MEMRAYDEYAQEYARVHPTLIVRPTLATEGQSKIGEVLAHPLLSHMA